MAATNQNIKDFFALTGNNPTVTNQQLLNVQKWLDDAEGLENSDANDLIDYLYESIKNQVISHKRAATIITF